jgi:hypothetical protein
MSSIFVTKLCELFNRPDTMTDDDAVWRWIRTERSSISMEVTYELEEGSLIEIVDVSEFEATVLPSLFPVPLRYSQFESLLLCHGFCIQSQTPNTRSYKHRYFIKGDRDAAEKVLLVVLHSVLYFLCDEYSVSDVDCPDSQCRSRIRVLFH